MNIPTVLISYWTEKNLNINPKRVAEVWLDEYKRLFYLHRPELKVIYQIFKVIKQHNIVELM